MTVWNKEKIQKEIKKLHNMNVDLKTGMRKNYSSLYEAARHHFGKWSIAVESCGISYSKRQYWSKDDVDIKINDIAINKGQLYLANKYNKDSGYWTAARRYYGSWRNAIESLGYKYDECKIDPSTVIDYKNRNTIPIWDKEKIIIELNRLIKSGENLIGLQHTNSALYQAIRRYYGSLYNLIEILGYDYNDFLSKKKRNKEKIIEEIKMIKKKKDILYLINSKNKNTALWQSAIIKFGSWKQAVNAAGFDYEYIKNIYNKKSISDSK